MTSRLEMESQFAQIEGPRSAFERGIESYMLANPGADFSTVYVAWGNTHPRELASHELFSLARAGNDEVAERYALARPELLDADRHALTDKLTASHEAEHFSTDDVWNERLGRWMNHG